MNVVYYKLPDQPENIVVADASDMFQESEVALLFGHNDAIQPHRYKVICEGGVIRAHRVDDKEEFTFFVEDHNNFWCIIGQDSVENAILDGQFISAQLRNHEAYYDRLED